jgi:hypothetical protein
MQPRHLALIASLLLMVSVPAAAAAPPLTPDGWGKLRIGMPEAELSKQFNFQLPPYEDDDSRLCREFDFTPAGPGVSVMAEDGRIARISVWRGGRLKTLEGLGIGSSKAEVRRRLGAKVKVEPKAYDDRERYLTVWDRHHHRGIRFETNAKGVVRVVHAGGDAINYIEGCS